MAKNTRMEPSSNVKGGRPKRDSKPIEEVEPNTSEDTFKNMKLRASKRKTK